VNPTPALNVDLIAENTPACLRERRQWVAWKYIERDGKQTKAPVNPHSGGLADSTDSSTWGTFQQATDACRQDGGLAGVGFVFTADDPYCGVDLDDCLDAQTGEAKGWAADVIDQLDSYTETSPSGSGVKIFLEASKPGRRCRKAYYDGEVEIYDRDRFFTLTGQRSEQSPAEIHARQEQLTAPPDPTPPPPLHSSCDRPRGQTHLHHRRVECDRLHGTGPGTGDEPTRRPAAGARDVLFGPRGP